MTYRNDRRNFLAPVLLALVLLGNLAQPAAGKATLPAAPDSPNPKTISIAEARALPLGTVVTVDGSVTVASGAFSSSTFDQGFAIQDHTGGIYVSTPDNLGFAPRQQVRVTGTLADNVQPGLLVLTNVTEAKAHGSGPKVQPLPVATGAVGEATEGKLVRITGTITQPVFVDPPFGSIIFINDGSGEVHSFVSASTGIDVSGLSPGQTIEVTGFSSQFADHYEVDPRTQADIKVLP
jgi:DNA/RNA endonuclease YhcR with UshA esterase domain